MLAEMWIMNRTHQTAFVLLFLGLAVLNVVMTLYRRYAESPEQQQQANARQIDRTIEALKLYCVSEPPHRQGDCKLIVSESPIPDGWQSKCVVGHPDFDRWRGTVAIYVGQAVLIDTSSDPKHPERSAVWAGAFVYGDPALIARLRAHYP